MTVVDSVGSIESRATQEQLPSVHVNLRFQRPAFEYIFNAVWEQKIIRAKVSNSLA